MTPYFVKVHKHNGSSRVTIPKEIIKDRGWEDVKCFVFTEATHGNFILSPAYPATRFALAMNAHGKQPLPHPSLCICDICLKAAHKDEKLSTTKT